LKTKKIATPIIPNNKTSPITIPAIPPDEIHVPPSPFSQF